MCTRQVASAHEEFAYDLTTGELERLFEQLRPLIARLASMYIEPCFERSVLFLKPKYHSSIVDRCIDFESVPDDAWISEEAGFVSALVGCDLFDIERVVRLVEIVLLFEDGVPAEACLVDFKHEPFKELVIALKWESILRVVIDAVHVVLRKHLDICAVRSRLLYHGASVAWTEQARFMLDALFIRCTLCVLVASASEKAPARELSILEDIAQFIGDSLKIMF